MAELDKLTIANLLLEIKRVASHASLTGSLRKGAPLMADVYNKCLDAVTASGDELARTIFPRLERETSIDEVGTAAALLAGYLGPRREKRIHVHGGHLEASELPDEMEGEIRFKSHAGEIMKIVRKKPGDEHLTEE